MTFEGTTDPERWIKTAAWCEGVKLAVELQGRRQHRFVLLPADDLQHEPTKLIHLVRHGQGHHNIADNEEKKKAKRGVKQVAQMVSEVPHLHDPDLTETGREEALASQPLGRATNPELLVFSPVRRATQTGFIVFEDKVAAGVPIMAHELCRENLFNTHPSLYDKRKGRSALQKEFPKVDYSLVLEEEGEIDDPLWANLSSPFGPCDRPSFATVVEQAWAFLNWLMARPEQEIGIASHSGFLLALFHGCLDPPAGKHPHGSPYENPQLFRTGELRSVRVKKVDAPTPTTEKSSCERWGSALGCAAGHRYP